MSVTLSKGEANILLDLLENLEFHQDVAGCNDFSVKITKANIPFLKALQKKEAASDDEYEATKLTEGRTFYTSDSLVLRMLKEKIEKELGLE